MNYIHIFKTIKAFSPNWQPRTFMQLAAFNHIDTVVWKKIQKEDHENLLFEMPRQSGKTYLLAMASVLYPVSRVLFVCHNQNHIDNIRERLIQALKDTGQYDLVVVHQRNKIVLTTGKSWRFASTSGHLCSLHADLVCIDERQLVSRSFLQEVEQLFGPLRAKFIATATKEINVRS
jgi:superfamily II DNA or RNA helicase